jgi:hypothetical protein
MARQKEESGGELFVYEIDIALQLTDLYETTIVALSKDIGADRRVCLRCRPVARS